MAAIKWPNARCEGNLPRNPSAANRKDLADKAVCRIAAKVGHKLGVFTRGDKATQRYLSRLWCK